MEEDEIIEKIDKFFEKENLEVEAKFALCKRMEEAYWDEWQGEEEVEEPVESEEDILGVEESEEGDEDTPKEETGQEETEIEEQIPPDDSSELGEDLDEEVKEKKEKKKKLLKKPKVKVV